MPIANIFLRISILFLFLYLLSTKSIWLIQLLVTLKIQIILCFLDY